MKVSRTKILNQLVKMVCEKEGGKKQLNAGNCRQAIKVIAMLELQSQYFCDLFDDYRCELLKGTPKKAKKKK